MALPPRPRQLALQLVSAAAWASAAAAQAQAQPTTAEAAPDNNSPGGGGGVGIKVSFRPSVAIVVGIFTMIFSLTFLLLMYAKFCHPSSSSPAPATGGDSNNSNAALPQEQQHQAQGGVPKAVIESLPFFRFATLRGSRQGMECSVCLARFDDADLLRLLPRCRHAFHLACVDRWLESNASCPLCRTRVDDADAALGLKYPSSARIVFGGDAQDDAALSRRFDDTGSGRDLLEIFVERVPAGAAAADDASKSPAELDRHRHHIIVSDAVFKSRWSELNSATLLALDTEMMMMMMRGGSASSTSGFFPDCYSPPDECSNEASSNLAAAETRRRRETERKRLLGATGGGGSSADASSPARMTISSASGVLRSMSEIVSLPRLRAPAREPLSEEENRYQQRWLPIAQRTARWFAGRSRARGEGDDGDGEQAQGAKGGWWRSPPRRGGGGGGGGACDV